MVNSEEAKEKLLSNNPEYKTLYKEDELEGIVDALCQNIKKVRKFAKGVDKMIAEIEKYVPKFAIIITNYFYNLDEYEYRSIKFK